MSIDRLTITHEPSAPDDLKRRVVDGLLAHNEARHGPAAYEPLALFLRDAAVECDASSAAPALLRGEVYGGLLGRLWWGWLHVEKLWVDDRLRGRGHGGRLLDAAERVARERGCTQASLDTVDPAAFVFYTRRGYEPYAVLEDFPPGARQWYLRKRLAGGEAR